MYSHTLSYLESLSHTPSFPVSEIVALFRNFTPSDKGEREGGVYYFLDKRKKILTQVLNTICLNDRVIMQQYTLDYIIEQTPDSFIGQCVQFPQILTEAKTKNKLKKEMSLVLDGYFTVCPQALETLKKNVGHGTYTVKKNA